MLERQVLTIWQDLNIKTCIKVSILEGAIHMHFPLLFKQYLHKFVNTKIM